MIAILPVGMNYRTERLPIVTFSLIGLNTLIWLVSLICFFNTGGESEKWIVAHLWLIPEQSHWWTFLTSMFVHAGIFHLLGNMIYLFLFGCCVEDMIGRVRFTLFYLASGLVAEFAFIAFSPEHFNSDIPMGGASGAISACMGMYLLLRADADIEFKYFYWLFVAIGAGEFEVPAWVAITFWFLSDLLWMIVDIVWHHHGGGTAFGAHVGGLLAGLALVTLYKWIGRQRESVAENESLIIDPVAVLAATTAHHRVEATSETPTIFLHDGTNQSGPFTLTQVQAMLHTGAISQEMEYWSEGLDNWQSVADLSDQPGG